MQIAVSCGDDADVGTDRRAPADGSKFALLEHAQEPSLGVERHVTDLVKEQGAAFGLLETAGVARRSPGEGALLVPKQFALDQLTRQGRHIDGDEGAVSALAVVVQGFGDEFLAGTRFADDHHRHVCANESRQHPEDILHRLRAANQRQFVVERRRSRRVRGRSTRLGQRPVDDTDQLVQIEGFRQVLEGPPLGRLDRGHQRLVGAHGNDPQTRSKFSDARDQIEPVTVRHHYIGDDQIPFPVLDPAPQGCGIAGGTDSVSLAA